MKYPAITAVLNSINKGFNIGLAPQAVAFGVSGSYFLRGADKSNLAIFKPFDEEPNAPNNPKGFIGKFGSKAMRDGILSGEGAAREVAAFMLDKNRVHKVPETFFAEVLHPYFQGNRAASVVQSNSSNLQNMVPMIPGEMRTGVKYGSLQFLKMNDGEGCNFSSRLFDLEDMQAIAALDIRILNCDRNEGNLLVRKRDDGKLNLIPIDHALSLPDSLSICDYEVCWTIWGQTEQPTNEKLSEYICSLNTKQNAKMLKTYIGLRPECLKNFIIAETLLVQGTLFGLTLSQIGKILYKDDPDNRSILEEIVLKTEEITKIASHPLNRTLTIKLKNIRNNSLRENLFTKSAAPRGFLKKTEDNSETEAERYDPKYSDKNIHSLAPRFDKIPMFLESSQLDLANVVGSRNSISPSRKRAMSFHDIDNSMDVESKTITLKPVLSSEEHKVKNTMTPKKKRSENNIGLELKVEKVNSPVTPNSVKKLQRQFSNPDLRKVEEVPSPSQELSAKKITKQVAPGKLISSVIDSDLFFYYFEQFLKQTLEKIQSNCKPTKKRLRLYSHI